MPLFASLADMQATFEERDLIQMSDWDNTGSIDAARIETQLVKADALITSYVASRHRNVASLAGNPVLTAIACDYAFALLYRANLPEWIKERRDAAVKQLSDIAKGVIKLDQGEEVAAPRPGQILISSDAQRFSRDKLSGY